ncbi:SDR family NAD(P)-dependent oxidoreductase [Cesiribacter andamanensis]|uniref:Cholesterol dehydrogenase n=1 Tax=Cesiribacter andamanensis AMV16 TaxID=1279009 RepID=M7NM39_9BACT|nr:SDR family NAD(P)-dependent oxidoreductase [Cesiribacter andamanensis]EMR02835.1 Cholesterol dehydrogenase [Cesiribacter andamanensis AMV16]
MIFLTGASGLIGSHIARRLLAEGYAVRALRRSTSNLQALADLQDRIDWVEGDLLDTPLLLQALEGCEQVIHCAGMVSFAPKDAEALYQTNVEGTASLVNAALIAGISRFVHISSVAAIGRPRRKGVVDEEQKWEKSPLNSWYGETKYLAELEVWRAHTEGLPVVIFNPSVVLGPGPMDRSSTRLFGYVQQKGAFYPSGLLNWVDVRDVVAVVMASLQSRTHVGQRYIVSAGSVRYSELFGQMADCLEVSPPKIQVNSLLTTGAYYLEKFKVVFGKKEAMITRETRILSNLEIEFDNSKITKAFNLRFHSLPDTIRWTCQHLEAQIR